MKHSFVSVFVYNYRWKEIKNRLRSFQPQNCSKIKNNPGCPKKPWSYKIKNVYYISLFSFIQINCWSSKAAMFWRIQAIKKKAANHSGALYWRLDGRTVGSKSMKSTHYIHKHKSLTHEWASKQMSAVRRAVESKRAVRANEWRERAVRANELAAVRTTQYSTRRFQSHSTQRGTDAQISPV